MHTEMIACFFIRRTNWRAHVTYVVKADLDWGKRIEIRRAYHVRFFDIFHSLLGFKSSTYPKVLSDIWDGTKKGFASTLIWWVIHRTVRYEKNLMLATLYLLRDYAMSDWIYLSMDLYHSIMQQLPIHVGQSLLFYTICCLGCAWKNIISFLH